MKKLGIVWFFYVCFLGLVGDGFFDGGLELWIVWGGFVGELCDYFVLVIYYVFVEILVWCLVVLFG